LSLFVAGQNAAKTDSLARLIAEYEHIAPDTTLVKHYINIGNEYEGTNLDAAASYYLKAGALADSLDWKYGQVLYSLNYSQILNIKGLLDSSLTVTQIAMDIGVKTGNNDLVAQTTINLGNIYNYKTDYMLALNCYMAALTYFEKSGRTHILAQLYDLLQLVHYNMNNFDEAITYGEKALAMTANIPDDIIRADILINLSNNYQSIIPRQSAKAKEALTEVIRIAQKADNLYYEAIAESNLANVYLTMREFDIKEFEAHARRSLELHELYGDTEGLVEAYRGMAYLEWEKHNFDASREWALKGLPLAKEYSMITSEREYYAQFADLALIDRDLETHRIYRYLNDSISNEMVNKTMHQAVKDMSVRYETEQKELRIDALEREKRLTLWLGLAGGVVLLLCLTALFFVWRYTVQKRRLAEQHIKQLEQEKQLIATQAMFDGEVKERTRIAQDLHDRLGGILTATKYSLAEMQRFTTSAPASEETYGKTMSLLDESISEMRRVAHHLMPEALLHFGLKAAIGEFCKSVPHTHFFWFGGDERFEVRLELVVYRIAYELVNNALKHSGATIIRVQIVRDPDRIALTVEDNGCGFDVGDSGSGGSGSGGSGGQKGEGMGMSNVRAQVASFNGAIDVGSVPGEGTEINVEFQLV
jgi:signal transduction histidine kinase